MAERWPKGDLIPYTVNPDHGYLERFDNAGSIDAVTNIDVDTSTPPGTDPVVPNASHSIILTGGQVASAVVGANVIRTNSLAANTATIEIQQTGSSAAQDTTLNGVAHFNSSQFTVANGFVSLSGGGAAIDSINVDASTPPGTDPVLPDGTGQITVTGAQVANGAIGANVIRTNSTVANTYAIEIQRSASNAASDSTKNGVSHFDSSHFTVDADGFVELNATGPILTLTPDEDFDGSAATPISPQAGNINVSGARIAASPITETYNSNGLATGDLEVEHRAWTTAFVVDSSTTPGARGTFSTIQAAITAASAGTTIFIRPGTYTENLTLKAGVNLTAYGSDKDIVTIVGKMTMTTAGVVTLSGVRCQTNGDYLLEITGSAASAVVFQNGCYLNCSDFTGINLNSSGVPIVLIIDCAGNLATTGIGFWTGSTNGLMAVTNSVLNNTGGSTTATTLAGGQTKITNSILDFPVSVTSAGAFQMLNSTISCQSINATALTQNGTGGDNILMNSTLTSGTASAISVGAGAVLWAANTWIRSSNANVITGAGQIVWGNLTFQTNSTINTTTQTPLTCSNNAVKVTTPGAYPYTCLPQDYVILVDTSAARSINLNASPFTGQTYRIKDNVGSAAANNITITPAAGNIDGAASYAINLAYGSVDVCYNGTQWNIL